MLEHNLAVGSVSKRLSHAGIDSKLMIIGSCGFHRQVAQELCFFLRPTFMPWDPGEPLAMAANENGVGENGEKMQIFYQLIIISRKC